MNNLVIERLRHDELDQYKRLIDACFENSSDIETYREMYSEDKNYEIIAAKLDNKIVGSITIVKIDLFTFSFQPMLELFNVCVDPKYREEKIGTAMIEYVVEFAKKNKYRSIVLTCLDDLPIVHKFYEKAGFSKSSSRKYAMYL